MGSQTDLDQGGTFREWTKVWMGPSIGWVPRPTYNVLLITAPGTYTIDRSTSNVNVNSAIGVIVVLPSTLFSVAGATAQPGTFVANPVIVTDLSGNANAAPITINPAAGDTIMGLSSIQLTANYGAFTLLPNSGLRTWNNVSP